MESETAHTRSTGLKQYMRMEGESAAPRAMLTIDRREKKLLDAYDAPCAVETLDVGDFICCYENKTWIGERKTVQDLAASLKDLTNEFKLNRAMRSKYRKQLLKRNEHTTFKTRRRQWYIVSLSVQDGRWHEQTSRLMSSGCQVIFVVEGDLKSVHFPYESLIGATVNAELRHKCHVFRTWDIWETALLLRHLVSKMEHFFTCAPNGLRLAPKRKRDSDSETCWLRMLMCVPSVSEHVAKALLKQFGTLANVQSALVNISNFPRVQLNGRTCIGTKRLKTLRAYLVAA